MMNSKNSLFFRLFHKNFQPLVLGATISVFLISCASQPTTQKNSEEEIQLLKETLQKTQDKLSDLESRLLALNEKVLLTEPEKKQTEKLFSHSSTKTTPSSKGNSAAIPGVIAEEVIVTKPSTDPRAIPKEASQITLDREIADRYREARILFDSKRYSDALLEFHQFLKDHPSHALAPMAQYWVGRCYQEQKEWTIANDELMKGLVNYPHSHALPDLLTALVTVQKALGKNDKADYFQEKLVSLFPTSPQAKPYFNPGETAE